MEPDVPGPWRKSDSRLVTRSVISLVVVSLVGILAFGIYSSQKTASPADVLGTETDNSPTPSPKPTPQALPTLPGTTPSPTASPSAIPIDKSNGQE